MNVSNNGPIIVKQYTSREFVHYVAKEESPDGSPYYTFLNGLVVHPTVPALRELVKKLDADAQYFPNNNPRKAKTCVIKHCKNPPCQSYLNHYYCPEHYADLAVQLRTPDIHPEGKYGKESTMGSRVTIRLIPDEDDDEMGHYQFANPSTIRFIKGNLHITIGGLAHKIDKWGFQVEEVNGERTPVFLIFQNIHFEDIILKDNYDAVFEGQPCCENLLKGYDCQCIDPSYPYPSNSLPELLAPAGVPGVFPVKNRKALMCGHFGVRCAKMRKQKPVAPIEREIKPKVNKMNKSHSPFTEDNPKFLQADREILQKRLELAELISKQKTRELQILEAALAAARCDFADLEKQHKLLQKKRNVN